MKKQFQIPPAEDLPLLNGMLSSQPRTLAALFLSAGLLAACGGSGGEGQQSGGDPLDGVAARRDAQLRRDPVAGLRGLSCDPPHQ